MSGHARGLEEERRAYPLRRRSSCDARRFGEGPIDDAFSAASAASWRSRLACVSITFSRSCTAESRASR